jgi:hypothetical protein
VKENWIPSFIKSAGAILLAAALMRFVIAAGNSPVLPLSDPMVGIPLRYAMLAVGAFELVVALVCLFGKKIHFQIGWLAWLATNLVVFHAGLFWMHCHPQATCIGSLTDPMHLSRGASGYIFGMFPIYLVFGSYAAVIQLWLGRTTETSVNLVKMCCPACGGHIKFAAENVGRQIPCPHCQAAIALQSSGTLKMACFFCQEHIEYPADAVGQKIPCPHCAKTITLLNPA